jgi:prepilin-type processing-associated H-X9-DG protein
MLGWAVLIGKGEPTGRAAAGDDAKGALPADLARILPDSFVIASINIDAIWNSEAAKGVREKALKSFPDLFQEFEKLVGVDIKDIERITMVMDGLQINAEPVFVVATKRAVEPERVLKAALPQRIEKNTDNGTIYIGRDGERKAMSFIDGNAFVLGGQRAVESFVEKPASKKEGPLTPVLKAAAGKHALVAGMNPAPLAEVKDQLPAEAEPFKPLIEAKSSLLTVDLTNKLTAELRGTFANAKDAENSQKAVEALRELLTGILGKTIEETAKRGKEWEHIAHLLNLADSAVKEMKLQRVDATLQASVTVQADLAMLNVSLIEAVQKIRESAARMQSQNNLRQIALAFHNYHDVTGAFPPAAVYDKNGKPLLSWRVLILPYIEQDNLYKEFHLDEPWDSEHNKKLLEQMPPIYRAADEDVKKHLTRYLGFSGKGSLFDGAKGKRITDITDGTSNTIMVVEAAKGVPWSKPEDIPFGPGKLLPLVVNPKKGGFNAAFCDGSVRFFPKSIKEEVLRMLVTISGGEVLPADFDK